MQGSDFIIQRQKPQLFTCEKPSFHSKFFLPPTASHRSGDLSVMCKTMCLDFVCSLPTVVFLGFMHAQSLSHVRLLATPWTIAHQAPLSMEFFRQEYLTGQPFPSQGIFPTRESNLGFLHCRQILYRLSHQGSPFFWITVSISPAAVCRNPHGCKNKGSPTQFTEALRPLLQTLRTDNRKVLSLYLQKIDTHRLREKSYYPCGKGDI